MKELVVTYWEGNPQIAIVHYLRTVADGGDLPVVRTVRYHDDSFIVDYDEQDRVKSVEIVNPSKARKLLNGLLEGLWLEPLSENELKRLE